MSTGWDALPVEVQNGVRQLVGRVNEHHRRRHLRDAMGSDEPMPNDTLIRIYNEYHRDPHFAALRKKTVFVPGDGAVAPVAVLVGEAPGAQEEKNKRPFCGASGNLLDSLLHTAGLRRSEVFVTNVVKYRPPDNRDPEPVEVEASKPYLRREVKVLAHAGMLRYGARPPVVLLGRHALSLVDEDLRISHVHGQPFRRGVWTYLPLYHPAVALYDGSKRAALHEDVKVLTTLLPSGVTDG